MCVSLSELCQAAKFLNADRTVYILTTPAIRDSENDHIGFATRQ